jgi:hypothetical protein
MYLFAQIILVTRKMIDPKTRLNKTVIDLGCSKACLRRRQQSLPMEAAAQQSLPMEAEAKLAYMEAAAKLAYMEAATKLANGSMYHTVRERLTVTI